MGTSRIREDQLAFTETETTELRPGLGFTEDTKHVLLSNISDVVTETSSTESNNLTANQNCLYRNEADTTCSNNETTELKPGLGFTEDTKHVLLSHSSEAVNETSSTESNNLNASQNCLYRNETVTTCSTVTEGSAYSNDNCTKCSYATCSEKELSSKSKKHGSFALNGSQNYDNVKDIIGLGENKLDSALVDGLNEVLTESNYDKVQTVVDDKTASLDEEPVSIDPATNIQKARSLRKGDSLSSSDLEEDTIRAVSCNQRVLKDAPDCVPPVDLPRVTLHKGGGGPRCLLSLPKEQTIGNTEVYIQHERATESQLGDKFGASVETCSTRVTGYYEHFFTDIEQGGVAEHMKIKSGDQLVLLNGNFVPNFSHKEVLQELSTVPVDSHTRLSLIILRSVSTKWKPLEKRKWVWIDTSAILVPEYPKEPPAVTDPVYSTSWGSSHEERGVFKLKVQGTQLYVSISDGHVRLEVSECGDDEDRFNICVWTRCALDESTGQILYTACLYQKDPHIQYKNNYVNISDTAEVVTKTAPQWFAFGLLGSTQSFKDKELNKWLGCDVTNHATCGKFCLEKHPYYFAAYAVENQLYLRSDRRSDTTAMGTAETDRRDNYSYISHGESSIGLNTDNEDTDVDEYYCSVSRSAAYGSKQSVSADSGYSTDGGAAQG